MGDESLDYFDYLEGNGGIESIAPGVDMIVGIEGVVIIRKPIHVV